MGFLRRAIEMADAKFNLEKVRVLETSTLKFRLNRTIGNRLLRQAWVVLSDKSQNAEILFKIKTNDRGASFAIEEIKFNFQSSEDFINAEIHKFYELALAEFKTYF